MLKDFLTGIPLSSEFERLVNRAFIAVETKTSDSDGSKDITDWLGVSSPSVYILISPNLSAKPHA